ncbi:MAG: alpha/beta hydrolase [Phycisphaerae bacterium]|nr:alpha/beta hydrolase [Saprospiraceae bacterium]
MKKELLISLMLLPLLSSAQQTRAETKPFVLGSIVTLYSAELSEQRTLNIYLPAGYSPDSAATYPVIYLLDGSVDEDFIHVVGLVQYANFPWVNTMPKSIVVGIANVDRRRDFTFPTSIDADKKDFPTTGGSEKFIAFLEKELQPFINRTYKTNASRTLIGQSLGGLLATEILYKKPQLFNQYIIVSPSLWWDKESLLALKPGLSVPGFQQKTKVYIAVGKEGAVMENDAKNLYRKLKAIKSKEIQVSFEFFSKEDHASIMHQAVYNAFIKLNKAWR